MTNENFRAADAFRARRYEGPHRFTQKRPRSFVSALRSIAVKVSAKNQLLRVSASFDFRLLQHGVIPGSSQTRARESALQERMRPASCGLATMESGNGILCRTGRVVEANIDLRGGPDGIGRA